MTKQYNATLQSPSTSVVFTKYPPVMNSLCNHKEHATRWADGESTMCTCSAMQQYLHRTPPEDQHLVLDGDALNFQEKPLTSIATGSLQNKIFPPHKEIYKTLLEAPTTWTKKNSLPSMLYSDIKDLWNQSRQVHNAFLHDHITHKDITRFKQLFPDAVFHNEDKRATSLRIFCPVIYYECLTNTFSDPLVYQQHYRRDYKAVWQSLPLGPWLRT